MTPSLTAEQSIELTIDSLAFGNGAGVARHDGVVVFVDDGCPGDKVLTRVTAVKKRFAEAEIKTILQASPHRVPAPCPVATECGGCAWQHVDYQIQLQQKDAIVQKALAPLMNQRTRMGRIIASPKPYNYRNRIQLHKLGDSWGYHKKKSSEIVAIDSCLIADESINHQLNKVIRKDNQLPQNCRVEIQQLPGGKVKHTVTGELRDELGFSQVNNDVNQLLTAHLVALAKSLKFNVIHDLYAGTGNLSFPMAQAFENHPVKSVELNSQCHRDAMDRLNRESLPNLQLFPSSVESYLKSHSVGGEDLIIVDPPRAGLQKPALQRLIQSTFRHLIYVSCDPMTLKRDLSLLTKDAGLKVQSVQAFDMFPQTPHMETVVQLTR